MQLSDSLSLAFRTVKSNKLRTGITVTIIALGIMALNRNNYRYYFNESKSHREFFHHGGQFFQHPLPGQANSYRRKKTGKENKLECT